jgi:hypothetical protein
VLAANLGVILAQRSEGTVALVDADLQFGDIAVMLKLAPQHTIVDAVGSFERLDAGFLESLLATHQPSGLKVLPAPLEPAFADQIGAEQMNRIIGSCARSATTWWSTPPPTSTTWSSASSRRATTSCSWRAWTSPTSRTSRSACRPCACSTRR